MYIEVSLIIENWPFGQRKFKGMDVIVYIVDLMTAKVCLQSVLLLLYEPLQIEKKTKSKQKNKKKINK